MAGKKGRGAAVAGAVKPASGLPPLAGAFAAHLERTTQTVASWAVAHAIQPNTARVWLANNKWPPVALDLVARALGVERERLAERYQFDLVERVRKAGSVPIPGPAPVSEVDWGNVTGLARKVLERLTPKGDIFFDTPASGPASARDPKLLALMFSAIREYDNGVTIYSNEPSETGGALAGFPRGACRTVSLLALTACVMSRDRGTAGDDTAHINSAAHEAMAVIDGRLSGGAKWHLSVSDYKRVIEKVTVYKTKRNRDDPERLNPLTTILVKPAPGAAPPEAWLVDDKSNARREPGVIDIEDNLRLRRESKVMVICPLSSGAVVQWTEFFTSGQVKLEIVDG